MKSITNDNNKYNEKNHNPAVIEIKCILTV